MKKILALYLPQFHQIPENDEWWGEGFTEWVNVKKAQPLFDGHNQPRIPLNNNYYDLSEISCMRWQTKIAKENNIYGFCVYHYWFNGKLLLEKPMENYLKNEDIDFPFCFCWANEHWTNAWVSGENKIIMENDFNDKDDWVKHFYYLLPFFKDKRYIREDNKPIFTIYYPTIIEPLKEMMSCWNRLAKEEGFSGIKFIYQHYLFHLSNNKSDEIKKELFDYGIEFEPNLSMNETKSKLQADLERFKARFSNFLQTRLHLYLKMPQKKPVINDYDIIWENILKRTPVSNKMIPGGFIDWDNTARRGVRGSLLSGATPQKFKNYFFRLLDKAEKEYTTEYIIIFSWNEWAEGGYLEPDMRNGFGYLNAIKEVYDDYYKR